MPRARLPRHPPGSAAGADGASSLVFAGSRGGRRAVSGAAADPCHEASHDKGEDVCADGCGQDGCLCDLQVTRPEVEDVAGAFGEYEADPCTEESADQGQGYDERQGWHRFVTNGPSRQGAEARAGADEDEPEVHQELVLGPGGREEQVAEDVSGKSEEPGSNAADCDSYGEVEDGFHVRAPRGNDRRGLARTGGRQ